MTKKENIIGEKLHAGMMNRWSEEIAHVVGHISWQKT